MLEWRWLCAGQALEETLEPSSTVGDTARDVLGAGTALVRRWYAAGAVLSFEGFWGNPLVRRWIGARAVLCGTVCVFKVSLISF